MFLAEGGMPFHWRVWYFHSWGCHNPHISPYLYENMFAANPRFARGESRIFFDMLKSLRKDYFFFFPKQQTLKP